MDTDKNQAKPGNNKIFRFPGGRFGLSVLGFAAVNAVILSIVLSSNWTFPGGAVEKDVLSDNLKQSPSYGTWTWWAAHGYFENARTPDVVMMGSSLVNSACWAADAVTTKTPIDCALHHRVVTLENALEEKFGSAKTADRPTVVNVAVQGAGACDYYMMTRALMEGARKPKVLVLGVAPRDFMDNKMDSLGATEPFMFYQRYVNLDNTVARAYSNPFEKAMGKIEWSIGRLPLRRFHSTVAAYLADDGSAEKPRLSAGNQLLAALSNGCLRIFPGDMVVPVTVGDTWFDNTQEYVSRYHNPNPKHFKTQLFFFEEMLKRLKAQNIKVLVVEMPTLPINRAMLPASFWQSYLTQLSDMCSRQEAQYLDLSANTDFTQKDFVDTVHVNWRGGVKLLSLVADEIARRPQLAASFQNKMISSKKPSVTN